MRQRSQRRLIDVGFDMLRFSDWSSGILNLDSVYHICTRQIWVGAIYHKRSLLLLAGVE